jgi:hypothetical protein
MSRLFRYPSDALVAALLSIQALFWFGVPSFWEGTRHILPHMEIVPDVPSDVAVKALSLGDAQFFFRTLAFEIQNAGDSFGRFTPLKDYDYPKLKRWFELLDRLDSRSNFVPSLAAYLFSQSQRAEDTRYIVEYLDEHASRDMENKWWWMYQAAYLANHRLNDKQLALKLAYKLAATPKKDVPIWVRQMPALIHEELGEKEEALAIIYGIGEKVDNLSEGEMNYMRYFITERLGLMQDKVKELESIRVAKEKKEKEGK